MGDDPAGEVADLEVGAEVDPTTRTTGFAWRLSYPDGGVESGSAGRRRVASSTRVELWALDQALERARVRGTVRVRLHTSDPRLRRAIAARTRRAVASEIRPPSIDSQSAPAPPMVAVLVAAGDAPPAVLGAARAARLVAVERAERLLGTQERALRAVRERARSVVLEVREGGWVANRRYRVQLNPMRCECPAWERRWAAVPIAGRRGARLPCKHLVALAERLAVHDPQLWLLLARRAAP